MQLLPKGATYRLGKDELAWCRANLDVPQAALIVALVDDQGKGAELPEGLAQDALTELRKIRPREKLRIEQFFAWVGYNAQSRCEGIPAAVDRKTNSPTLLIGADLTEMRRTIKEAAMARMAMKQPLTMYRYGFDRVIAPEKIAHIRPQNIKTRTAVELFAYVTVTPAGDEMVMGYKDPNNPLGMQIMAHPDAVEIMALAPMARRIRQGGLPIELRRFVRAETINDLEFDLETLLRDHLGAPPEATH